MQKFKLGTEVEDKVTGFKGVIMGYAKYLTGCDQYNIQPECVKDGEYPEDRWFDEGRLKIVPKGKKVTAKSVQGADNGCDQSKPPAN